MLELKDFEMAADRLKNVNPQYPAFHILHIFRDETARKYT